MRAGGDGQAVTGCVDAEPGSPVCLWAGAAARSGPWGGQGREQPLSERVRSQDGIRCRPGMQFSQKQ